MCHSSIYTTLLFLWCFEIEYNEALLGLEPTETEDDPLGHISGMSGLLILCYRCLPILGSAGDGTPGLCCARFALYLLSFGLSVRHDCLLSIFMCLCVCVSVFVCVHMWKPEVDARCLLSLLSI